ncbi:MAG: type II toxin-antitoxin system RelE/ParE family toxin [Gammaproteobacteria bacterium]|jgi:phage-related protein
MKDIIYAGDSCKVISKFPDRAKQHILALLDGIKFDVMPLPHEFKYMPTVGKGVYELRIKSNSQYRVFYVTKFHESIYVLHAFVKKTQKTAQKDISIGKKRYKDLIKYRGNIK